MSNGEQPAEVYDANATKRRAASMLMQVLGDKTASLKISPNDDLIATYAPIQQNLQASTEASAEAGMPNFEGIDPELVLGLMKQRAVQDQQFRQGPMDANEMLYRNRVGAAQNPLYNILNTFQKQTAMDERQAASDRMATGRKYIGEEASTSRNNARIASQERIAKIYADARGQAGGKQPSLLQLNNALNVSQFDKDGNYKPPNPGEMDTLDMMYRKQGFKLLSLPLAPYAPWFSGNQPAQNAYFLVKDGQKVSQNTILQQLANMGYKGLTDKDIPELTGAR
jgi:hypothetical protein